MSGHRLKAVYVCRVCRHEFHPWKRTQTTCSSKCRLHELRKLLKGRPGNTAAAVKARVERRKAAWRARLKAEFGELTDRELSLVKLAIRFGYVRGYRAADRTQVAA